MKNKILFSFILMMVFAVAFESCDKIDPPFVEGTSTTPPPSGNSTDVIDLQDIKGVASDFEVTDNWLSDSSALSAVWTITPTTSGADGAITFTWHGISTTLNISSASGIITFNGPVSITVGGFYGTLSFTYNGTFTSSGSGEGYVAAYVLNEQNVLIEEFTGHMCGNCPPAAEKITELKGIYGERLLSMSIHAGSFAITFLPPYTYEFKVPEGIEIHDYFQVNVYPIGMVNRKEYASDVLVAYGNWASYLNEIIILNKFPDAGIKIENTYTASDSTLNTKVQTCFFDDLPGTYKLSVFLIEDSIQRWQKDDRYPQDPDLPDYWHRHVLRGSANGTWGEILSPSVKESIIEKSYSMTIKNEFRAAYCSTIVFVYDDATKEILQVKEAPIIQ